MLASNPELKALLGWSDSTGTPPVFTDGGTIAADVYPNPTNSVCYLSYSLSQASTVNIIFTDALGQNLSNLISIYNNQSQPGTFKVMINTDKVTPGLYYIAIKIGDQIITKKVSVL